MISGRRRLLVLAAVAVLLLLVAGRIAAGFATELLWYQSLGYSGSFWVQWRSAMAVRAAAALPIGLAVFLNLWLVTRSLGTIRVRRRYANIEIAERLPQSYVFATVAGLSVFSAWWLSAGVGNPLTVLAALRGAPWGVVDPVFGRDVGFYVFGLPVLDRIQGLGSLLTVWIALLVGTAYVATGAVKVTDGRPAAAPAARRHLGLLGAAFLIFFAWDLWLDRYGLVVAGNGIGSAVGYSDVHARLPGRLVLAGLAVAAAAAVGYGAWHGVRRLPLAALAALGVGALATGVVYPALVQKLRVEPNEFERERPYIERHLEFTRLGYGLADLKRAPLPYDSEVTLDPERLLARLGGVPLWDPRPLQATFDQRQTLFRYYNFPSVHVDRYGEGAEAQQVAIAVRELDAGRLEANAQTWQNLHLNYVSGQGAVVSPVAQAGPDGAPRYFVWDLDPPKVAPDAPAGLALEEPRVFVGQDLDGYVVLGADAPAQGVALDATWKKLLFAWSFQSRNLLLSSDITPESRILYRRRIHERARAVAPFLDFTEEGVVPVLHEGRVVWILDGFTSTGDFPLSPWVEFNGRPVRYLRNPVKLTIDGVTGDVRVYALDAADPILAAYAAIFPGLVRPLSEMPEGLRRHLRVSPRVADLQALVLGEYHLTEPQAFYAKEDVWARPTEQYRNESLAMQPTFAMLPLPGEAAPEFLLTVPFVSRGRLNMTAMLVTRNDPPHYGEQILYELPRDELIPGPRQVESLIDQDPEISQQLSLWQQGGSDVLRGRLVPVPVDSTIVYVEPLFLEAQDAAIPQLARVVMVQGGEAVMRPTVREAVTALLGGEEGAPARPSPDPLPAPSAAGEEVLVRARRLIAEAETALRNADWIRFGRVWDELSEVLRREGEGAGPPS